MSHRKHNLRSGGWGRSPAPRAFTIVELLIVITILGLLVAILVPSVTNVRQSMRVSASLAAVRMIDGACQMYQNDFNDFPPSLGSTGTPYSGWQGCELLPLLLSGYAGDDGDDGSPRTGLTDPNQPTNLANDDGVAGFGYRLAPRGRQYGPYNGTEKLAVGPDPNGRPVFLDAFGNPIFYYRFGDYSDGSRLYHYNAADNNNGLDPGLLTNYVSKLDFGHNLDPVPPQRQMEYFRSDYVLFSAGPNRVIDCAPNPQPPNTPDPPILPRTGGQGWDDITNFFLDRRTNK